MIQISPLAAQFCRLDEVHDVDIDGDRARQPVDARRIEQAHHQYKRNDVGRQHRKHDKCKDQRRNCHDQIDEARHELVEPAADDRCRKPQHRTQDKRQCRRHRRDEDGDPRAVNHARQQITPEIISAEPVLWRTSAPTHRRLFRQLNMAQPMERKLLQRETAL